MDAEFMVFVIIPRIIVCETCKQEFFFNNKLHKHLKNKCMVTFLATQIEAYLALFDAKIFNPISIISKTVDGKDTGYAFKIYQYVIIKKFLICKA